MLLSVVILICLASVATGQEKRILLEDNYYTLVARLDALEKQVSRLDALEQHVNAVEAELASLKQNVTHLPKVVFMAELTKTVTGTNDHIYFDKVTLNEGNAYNPHHGTFVAPFNGTYQFAITSCSARGHYNVLDLVVNTAVVGKLLVGDNDIDECSSKTFLARLNSADDVYVRHQTAGDYVFAHANYGLPVFGGFLLHTN